jgi:hypothetical protein
VYVWAVEAPLLCIACSAWELRELQSDRILKMRFTDHPAIHWKAITYYCSFRLLTCVSRLFLVQQESRARTETVSLRLKINTVCAYLKFNLELSICAAKNKQISCFILVQNVTLCYDDIFVHIWFILWVSVILLFNTVNKFLCCK